MSLRYIVYDYKNDRVIKSDSRFKQCGNSDIQLIQTLGRRPSLYVKYRDIVGYRSSFPRHLGVYRVYFNKDREFDEKIEHVKYKCIGMFGGEDVGKFLFFLQNGSRCQAITIERENVRAVYLYKHHVFKLRNRSALIVNSVVYDALKYKVITDNSREIGIFDSSLRDFCNVYFISEGGVYEILADLLAPVIALYLYKAQRGELGYTVKDCLDILTKFVGYVCMLNNSKKCDKRFDLHHYLRELKTRLEMYHYKFEKVNNNQLWLKIVDSVENPDLNWMLSFGKEGE